MRQWRVKAVRAQGFKEHRVPRYAPEGHERCDVCGNIKRIGRECRRCEEQAAQDERRRSVWPGTKCLFNGRETPGRGGKSRAVVRDDGKTYASVAEASNDMTGSTKSAGNIACACRGQRKTALVHSWRFEGEEG